jgi:hypothetical protein
MNAMMMSSAMYFISEEIMTTFHKLGFPDFFRIELGIAKFLGAIALLAPLGSRVKEWAYFGFALTFVSAFALHLASGDPVSAVVSPLVALSLLIVSYLTYHRREAVSLGKL